MNINKKKIFIALLLVAILTSAAFAEMAQNFKLVNSSGRTFRRVWVGPSSNRRWSDADKVNMNPLKSGWHTTITFHNRNRRNVRYWDLRVDLTNGKKWEWHDLDLFEIYEIEIDRYGTAHYSR